jgi:hypothetical protein
MIPERQRSNKIQSAKADSAEKSQQSTSKDSTVTFLKTWQTEGAAVDLGASCNPVDDPAPDQGYEITHPVDEAILGVLAAPGVTTLFQKQLLAGLKNYGEAGPIRSSLNAVSDRLESLRKRGLIHQEKRA